MECLSEKTNIKLQRQITDIEEKKLTCNSSDWTSTTIFQKFYHDSVKFHRTPAKTNATVETTTL